MKKIYAIIEKEVFNSKNPNLNSNMILYPLKNTAEREMNDDDLLLELTITKSWEKSGLKEIKL